METLTIKELATYLPYELKIKNIHPNINGFINTLDCILLHRMFNWETENTLNIKWNKPILHPLSDLTKPITHNGETFVPMEKLCNDFCNRTPCNPEFGTSKILMHADNGGGLKWWFVYHRNKMTFELSDDNRDMSNHTIPQYEMFQKLFEWHFDVFGLIPRNLAIDINTIKIAL